MRVLIQVLSHQTPLDQALQTLEHEFSDLNSKDAQQRRAALLDLTAGTLRWKGRLEQALDSLALKKRPSGRLRKILLLSAYQLMAQEKVIPARVVSETVSWIRAREGERPAAFANAVLRKLTETLPQWKALNFPEGHEDAQASWASLPLWFWKKLVQQQGVTWAKSFSQASLERPRLWLRQLGDLKEGFKSPALSESTEVSGASELLDTKELGRMLASDTPCFIVQDLSSQFLISEVHGLIQPELRQQNSHRIRALDLCAAPGGKSLALAGLGLQVTATDFKASRLQLLRASIERCKMPIEVVEYGEVESLPLYDLVWVDAPCSGSGIIRRHPEIRWIRTEAELGELRQIQKKLIDAAWRKVRPGGFLAYSVCSVFREEGEQHFEDEAWEGLKTKSWWLAPHLAPLFADGFWAVLVKKPQ